jgi:hypothetical protein
MKYNYVTKLFRQRLMNCLLFLEIRIGSHEDEER